MARGRAAVDGDTFVNKNGYHHTRVDGSWVATHYLVAAEKLGRAVGKDEYVSFADGDRSNLRPDNILVKKRGQSSLRRRQAQLVAKIDEAIGELQVICEELGEEVPRFPRA